MELSQQQEEFKKDLATAMAKAWESESFKKELIASPKEAIENVTGRKLNIKSDFNIIVNDQSSPRTFYINIPQKPDIENMELSENQLELISGGSDYWNGGQGGLLGAAFDLFNWGVEQGVEYAVENGHL